MATNWPPAPGSYPLWPPLEIGWFEACDLRTLLGELIHAGFTQAAPTAAERNQFFKPVTCSDGHAVIGRMLVSPDGTRRYPFAVCNGADRELLVLWPPYTMGFLSGVE